MAEIIPSNYRHTPVRPDGRKCPVCQKRVFSPAGIHPQCAVQRQIDRENAELKAAREAEAIAANAKP